MPPFEEETEKGRTMIRYDLMLDPPSPWADLYVLQQRKERLWAEGGVTKLRSYGIATVAEVDDNYLELPSWNPAFRGTHPYARNDGVVLNRSTRRRVRRETKFEIGHNPLNREYMHAMFRQVDAVTVSTPYLRDLYSKYNSQTFLLRNYLDWDIWQDVQPQYEVERWRRRIGYLGVFKYRQGDLDVLAPWIGRFMSGHPELDFVANSKEVHDYLGVPKAQRLIVPEYHFRPPEGGKYPLGEKTAKLDIGLVPLDLIGLNEGKSHLKGMEYNAAGIPFIASPTESYKDYWCEEGLNGFLAHNKKEWIEKLELLIGNDDFRRKMGRQARVKAKANTIQDHWVQWQNLYLKVLGGEQDRVTRTAIQLGAVQKHPEFAALIEFLQERKLDTIVEIGSARGGTFWAFAQIASEEALLVSIDIPAGSPLDVRGGKDVYGVRNRERLRSYRRAGQKVKLVDANSQLARTRDALKKILDGRQIDFLFIDGDHRYEGVKRDFSLYSPLVAEDGVIGFHDVIVQYDARAKVDRLWSELKRSHRDWYEFISPDQGKWGGIGVIVKEAALVGQTT